MEISEERLHEGIIEILSNQTLEVKSREAINLVKDLKLLYTFSPEDKRKVNDCLDLLERVNRKASDEIRVFKVIQKF